MKLEERDIALLRDFIAAMKKARTKCFLVGAGARVLTLDMKWEVRDARTTRDWDFAIRVKSWDEWRELTGQLVQGVQPKFRSSTAAHRFIHVDGGQLDLIPYGDLESPGGEILWPGQGRMSVHGLAESEGQCVSLEMGSGLIVPVAAVPSLALLKLCAYGDRRLRGERKDIQDFDWFLDNYESAGNEVRVHDDLGDVLRRGEIDVEAAGAALLGFDVTRIHSAEVIVVVRSILTESRDIWSRVITDVVAGRSLADDEEDRRRRTEVSRRFRAFELGLDLLRPGKSGRGDT